MKPFQREFWRTIQGKLILLILVLFVPTLLIQVYMYHDRLETRRAEELQVNLEFARAGAKAFEAFVQDVLHQELSLGLAITTLHPMSSEDITRLLEKSDIGNVAVRDFSWASPDGTFLLSSNPAMVGAVISDRTHFRDVVSGREWSVCELTRAKCSGEPIFCISRGIRDEKGALLGLVVATVIPERLDSVLSVKRAKGGGISIVDNKGMLVYRYPVVDLTWEERDRLKVFPDWKEALDGKEVTGIIPGSYDAHHYRIIASAPIASIGWAAGAGSTEERVTRAITSKLVSQAILFFLVISAALCTALLLSRFISTPVKRLRDHALSLGQGEIDKPAVASGPAELRELADSFNIMAGKLRKARDELELRVHERTIELQSYMQKLERSNQALQEFAYIASHDLQEPLRTVCSFVQLLERRYRGKLDAHADELIAYSVDGAKRMQSLINDLLMYSRVDTQGNPLEPTAMETIFGKAVSTLQARIEERGAVISHDPLPTLSVDPSQMARLFQNLIGNGLKFHSEKTSRVHVSAHRSNGEWVFSVKDNGIGIESKFFERIFKIFQRLHTRDEYSGTGIGLAVCKKIVERHGGRIWVESTPGEGAAFYFTVPSR